MNIIQDQTPNKTIGRSGKTVNTIVLHSTYGSYLGSVAWLKNPQAQASAHYIISTDGEIRQLVPEKDTAWQAGNFAVNQESIGIETTDNKQKEITPKAKEALIWLVQDIKKRHNIQHIKFHREVKATACPYLDIKKEWFSDSDPLTECLRQHGELVKELELVKKQLADAKETEKRLIAEKDQAVRDGEKKLAEYRSQCEFERVEDRKRLINLIIDHVKSLGEL